jgi:LTXXQ motif family protein
MKRMASMALLGLALAAAPLQSQGPGPMRGPGGPGGPGGAQFFLAHTGELELTDQQVVRLAGIARRAHQRHEAMRANMPQPPAPGAERRQPSAEEQQRMRQQMEQAREQSQADLRDALAVLTPDQQARAWQMMAHRGAPGGRGEMRGRRGPGGPGEMRGRRGPGGPGGPGRGEGGPEARPGGPQGQ